MGMGARAPPALASPATSTQVTLSHAFKMLDDNIEMVSETEIIVNEPIVSEVSANSDIAESVVVELIEATQPPTLSPYTPNIPQATTWNSTTRTCNSTIDENRRKKR